MTPALRAPARVMNLRRMGASFPTRLSFMRTLMRRLHREDASVARPVWEIDTNGYGQAVYTVRLGGHDYSLVAVSTPLDDADRTDRVIATAWDTSYVLYDGTPTAAEVARIALAAPTQEAARYQPSDLILSRANRSVRLFAHVTERLAAGRQPDPDLVRSVGYLMRTTAVYGNGKFGIADRAAVLDRPGMELPFHLEMLTVWLIRGFTLDLVEHIAAERSPETAVRLSRDTRRSLGIGNATGLGMAPFLVDHPILLNNWMVARETGLARVRAIAAPDPTEVARVRSLLDRARAHVALWEVDDPVHMARIVDVRHELSELADILSAQSATQDHPWDQLVRLSERWSSDTQELVVALLLEAHGPLVDDLELTMSASEEPTLDSTTSCRELLLLIDRDWGWALDIDFSTPQETALFWYISEEKLEPRLGRRHEESGADRERPLDVARQVQSLSADLRNALETDGLAHADAPAAVFLLDHPQHRHAITRVQTLDAQPYAEIRNNLIGEDCRPIDMLRAKLAFFGATRFDPRSDLWTRITMFQGAPLFDEVSHPDADDWWLPAPPMPADDSTDDSSDGSTGATA